MHQGGLWQEDVSLPARYWATIHGKADLDPVRRLLLAVLQDALHTYRNNVPRSTRHREVKDWLLENKADYPFSFRSICDSLDLSPERVRRGILELGERDGAAQVNAVS
jgi:hypothetical protein